MGAKIRQELHSFLDQGVSVALDFSGVNVVSNSFSDECIAKLLLEMPLEKLKQLTTFRNLTPMAERSILVALQRRYKMQ
ncbi:MAG: STAS-like domain-containing protein [bacterium]|nr:STAS-like domain-containing protein [Candidatus Limimorpha equi]